ncbi:coiled-coil domain-containing protein 50 isoform X1 [Hypanus sabinus]|uniref:coiled-coil domain-containing protein 50 isoform X1 n=1 Tax=Hypanus sabinus TaxID=79690 RepID=UPI0028C3E353|nr:coiled-coil domain-containing protein 50 isoform X1 [Hypanus sabinus]
MAELGIDQSSLPAVNAVCRQFAVREDHSLAHNLQEQEIEHHLASNVQRNRLVQHDLQVAKKLQEEENKKAQIRLQRHQQEIEIHDNHMAQVIRDELALENEKRRRQEEKDEAIARKLQKEEEKLRRKHQVIDREPLDAIFDENGDHRKTRVHRPDRKSKLAYGSHRNREPRDSQRRGVRGESCSKDPMDDWIVEPPRRGRTERLSSSEIECDDVCPGTRRQKVGSCPSRKEPPMRPPPPVTSSTSSYHRQGARPKFAPVRDESQDSSDHGVPCRAKRDCSPKLLGACGYSPEEPRGRRGEDRDGGRRRKERRHSTHSLSPDLQMSEEQCPEQGLKGRMEYGVTEAMHGISRMSTKELEMKDAELAQKLQQEEIRATQSSERAAQLARDEEIARLLMEEEKKQVLRKSKERDSSRRTEEERRKGSTDWRKPDMERKYDGSEYARARPRDELESLTGKPERPARPPAYRAGSDHLDQRPSSQRPSRPASRPPESPQKVSYYRQ